MYSKVQFIAHCLYTTTNNVWVDKEGTWKEEYNGSGLTTDDDIKKRIALVNAAITLAKEQADKSANVLKVFALPECFFQGKDGAYPIASVTSAVEKLQDLVKDTAWKDWIFALGTINGVYDAGGIDEIVNLAPVVKGGFVDARKAHENTALIQKALFCKELVKDGDLQGGGLTDKVRFGRTENEERAVTLLDHILKPEQKDKVEAILKSHGRKAEDWTELKKKIELERARLGDTRFVRVVRDLAMPDTLAWGRDWLPVAKKLVMILGRPLKVPDQVLAKNNKGKFKDIVAAAVEPKNSATVERVLAEQGFPKASGDEMLKQLRASLTSDELLQSIFDCPSSTDPIATMIWGQDWIGATKKLLALYVTQHAPIVFGAPRTVEGRVIEPPKIELADRDILLLPQKKENFNPDDFRFSFNDVVGPDGKKLAFGLEICADHGSGRLKAALKGAKPGSPETVDIQIIVSAGMCIDEGSMAVRAKGYLFNCDGCNIAGGMDGSNSTTEAVTFVHTSTDERTYTPHSEVRRSGSTDKFLPLRLTKLTESLAGGIFSKGTGNLHMYGAVDL